MLTRLPRPGCLPWLGQYNRGLLAADLLAAVIVSLMLIPQSLAYALLAGLPAEVGLYASMLPLILYAIFGSSRALAVGPVAVISLMTAAAVGRVAEPGSIGYLEAAMALAALSGLILTLMGIFRLGFLANFLSHPVISGFITASGILIALSQVKHLLGIGASGHNLFQLAGQLLSNLPQVHLPTLVLGALTVMFLFWVRSGLKPMLLRAKFSDKLATLVSRTGPVWAVILSILAVNLLQLDERGVAMLGAIPSGLPSLQMPQLSSDLLASLFTSALLISVVGFVESVSVAQTLAAKRRQSVDPDQELMGLGAANLGSAISGGMPVTGGFSRSVINFDAGAATPAAGIFTAVGIGLASLFLTPLISRLPIAVLAATIFVAVLSLIDFKALLHTWKFSRADASAMAATILATLVSGVELGILCGVGLSLMLYLHRTSRPHTAIVGLVPGTEHFRNIERHEVITSEFLTTLRIDASLYFANARFLENCISQLLASNSAMKHLVLMCPAVNDIDSSALDSLEAINERLLENNVKLHLSEVKGPVMDKLQRTDFLQKLGGQVFLTQFQAVEKLAPAILQQSKKTCHARSEVSP